MKVMIKTELERAFKSWSLWLALIIGMVGFLRAAVPNM